MRIAVLGPLEVRDDTGARVRVPGAKERLLLAVLSADAPRVVSSDRIVEALWNGDQPARAQESLLTHLVHLRSALEPGRPRGSTGQYVLRQGGGYALAAGRPVLVTHPARRVLALQIGVGRVVRVLVGHSVVVVLRA